MPIPFRSAVSGLLLAGLAAAAQAQPLPEPRPFVTEETSAVAPRHAGPPRPRSRPAGPVPDPRQSETGAASAVAVSPPEADPAPPPADAGAEIACRGRLMELGVVFEEMDPIDGEGACGAAAPVRVSGIGRGIRLDPPATLTCPMAEALARWAQGAVLPAAERHLDVAPTGLVNAASYVCRTRNSRPGAKLSEHATANAIDIGGFVFAEDEAHPILLRGDNEARERAFQRAARRAACRHFTTVIGPGTDAAHATHFHLDLAKRRGGYRLCQ